MVSSKKETTANKKGMIAETFLIGDFYFGKEIEENVYLCTEI